jgi:hypothetical protein
VHVTLDEGRAIEAQQALGRLLLAASQPPPEAGRKDDRSHVCSHPQLTARHRCRAAGAKSRRARRITRAVPPPARRSGRAAHAWPHLMPIAAGALPIAVASGDGSHTPVPALRGMNAPRMPGLPTPPRH